MQKEILRKAIARAEAAGMTNVAAMMRKYIGSEKVAETEPIKIKLASENLLEKTVVDSLFNKMAGASIVEDLLKTAGNPFTKRYWQYLKTLHGGTDNTVNQLSKTRDFGIYHGSGNVSSILKNGLNPHPHFVYGKLKGIFMAQKNTANRYGDAVRLKYPSELTSYKHNYPRPDRIVNEFNNKELRYMRIGNNKYDYQKLIHHGIFNGKRLNAEHNVNSIIVKDHISPNLIKKAGLIGSIAKHNLRKNKVPLILGGLSAYQRTKDKGATLAHIGRSISLGGIKVHQVENALKNNRFSKLHKKNSLEHLNNKIPVL